MALCKVSENRQITSCWISNSGKDKVHYPVTMSHLAFHISTQTFSCLHMHHARDVGELELGEESVEDLEVLVDVLGVVRGGGEALLPQEGANLLQGFGDGLGQRSHLFRFKFLKNRASLFFLEQFKSLLMSLHARKQIQEIY